LTGWLQLAAAPIFGALALLNVLVANPADILCLPRHGMASFHGMPLMYALMGIFHLGPWWKLLTSWRDRRSGHDFGAIRTSERSCRLVLTPDSIRGKPNDTSRFTLRAIDFASPPALGCWASPGTSSGISPTYQSELDLVARFGIAGRAGQERLTPPWCTGRPRRPSRSGSAPST
jgi:hypothetical protein